MLFASCALCASASCPVCERTPRLIRISYGRPLTVFEKQYMILTGYMGKMEAEEAYR